MTKKDYILIANTFCSYPKINETAWEYRQFLIDNLSELLKADNSLFDENKFITACGGYLLKE